MADTDCFRFAKLMGDGFRLLKDLRAGQNGDVINGPHKECPSDAQSAPMTNASHPITRHWWSKISKLQGIFMKHLMLDPSTFN